MQNRAKIPLTLRLEGNRKADAVLIQEMLGRVGFNVTWDRIPCGGDGLLMASPANEELTGDLAMAVDQAAEAIFITDLEGRLTYVNPAFELATGHPSQEALGTPIHQLLEGFPAPNQASGKAWQGRTTVKHPSGKAMLLDGTLTPVKHPQGAVASFVGVVRDITQEAETERNLNRMQKLDALGALAGGVAHDFNNLLTAIISSSELIEWQVPPDSPILPKLHVIYQAVNRARDLNRQILSFSRTSEEKHQPFDLSAVVKEAIFLLRSTFPPEVELRTSIASSVWILGEPNQIHQVVINLCINALQAMMPSGGTLELSLGEEDVEPRLLPDPPPGLREGRHVLLTVKDTGCGMDAATRERIFEPFFTTRAQAGCAGLGLSVVDGILHKHLAVVQVQSEPDQGCCLQVYFPCTPHDLPLEPEDPADAFKGHERIIFVDDEEVLTALGKQGLQMLGYSVTTRSNSREALEEFQHRPQSFDLLITDLSMPGLSGVELLSRIRSIRPDLPAILITGAFQAPTSIEGISSPFDEMAFKPITIQEIAKLIRKVIQRRPVPAPTPERPHKIAGDRHPGQYRLLLAEDSTVTRGLLRSWLTKAGYRVEVARDGQEAWEAYTQTGLKPEGFDLVLTDIVMPNMDGLELASRIREKDPGLPIVILSTSEDADAVKQALHLRVNEFLTKPFESTVLISCVERMLEDHAKRIKGLRSVETAQAVRMAQRAMEAIPEKGLPIYSISEPLTDAGGDVFRCHRVKEDSIFFAIADVAGHSVISSYAVAAYLGMLSNFVGECRHLRPVTEKVARPEVCTHFGNDRCEPLKHLALKLNQTIQTGPFSEVPICSLFGIWTPGTGRLHLLNAGIPHAQWFRHSLQRAVPVEINGTPLGILDDPIMEEKVICMEPGDRLLLGSDGFFDALSPENTPFLPMLGDLWRDLACTDILTAINLVSEAARAHAAGNFADDLLVVGLEQPALSADKPRFIRTIPSEALRIDDVCRELAAFMEQTSGQKASTQRFDTLLAVREALSNALFHGNHLIPNSLISVQAAWDSEGQFQVAVLDEGLGFDLEAHQPPDTFVSERGRGIPMIQHFAKEVVMTGGELLMTFHNET